MKKLASVLLVLLMVVSLAACGKKSVEKQLVGSWYRINEYEVDLTVTLYDDGTGNMVSIADGGGESCKWRVINDELLEITYRSGSSRTWAIESLDSDSLTVFIEDTAETETFHRTGK